MHDRYLVYRLLGRVVEMVPDSCNGKLRMISGVVDRVCRDIFNGLVEITVGGCIHRFREPRQMIMEDGNIVFVYGGDDCVDDEEVFRQVRDRSHTGETIYDVMCLTRGTPRTSLIFRLGPKIKRLKGIVWRRRRNSISRG